MRRSTALSALFVRIASSSWTSLAPASALALRVACSRLALAKSSCSAITRSALSIEIRVSLVAESTDAAVISEKGLATVGMGVVPGRGRMGHAAAGRSRHCAPQQFHSRKEKRRCQGDFGALHHGAAPALPQKLKI